jgi:hypothetical protein
VGFTQRLPHADDWSFDLDAPHDDGAELAILAIPRAEVTPE